MGEYTSMSPQGIGALLSNHETEKTLEFLRKLRSLGVEKYVDFPQLVVVGDQSSGKSSVLQAITKLPFPVDDRLCTRFATEVALHRSAGPESFSVEIRMAEAVTSIECTMFPFGSPEFAAEFERVLRVASEIILEGQTDSRTLSTATLHINVKGPNEIDLTIVDIPGLVSASHEAFQTAGDLVQRYIDNPKSIILAVAHPLDPDTQEVFHKIKNIPNKENRVIGVITKCDRKQEGAEQWILDTIKNERHHNNPHFLSQGWFGLRNRRPIEKDISNEERDKKEAEFFSQGVWADVNSTRLGFANLNAALTKMHNNHITNSIPELMPEIRAQLATCEENLAQLGTPRSSRSEQLDCMVKLAMNFSRLSADALDGYYHNLPDDKSAKLRKNVQDRLEKFNGQMVVDYSHRLPDLAPTILTSPDDQTWRQSMLGLESLREIHDVIRNNRGREFSDEVNPNVKRVLWKGKTTEWKTRASSLIEAVALYVRETMDVLMKAATPEDELQSNTMNWLASHLPAVTEAAMEELEKLLSDENSLWTLAPSYTLDKGALYKRFIKETGKSLVEMNRDLTHGLTQAQMESQLQLWLAKNKDVDVVLNTYISLKAYYETAMARFVDNCALQVIERHLLGPSSPIRMLTPSCVVKLLEDEPEVLRNIAGENEGKVADRAAINEKKTSLKAALTTARSYGFYTS